MDINKYIMSYLKRDKSLFDEDLNAYYPVLEEQIVDKSILVIGGAGTIGSSFIKAILRYRPRKLVVADNNENSLAELIRDLRSTNQQFVPSEFLTYPVSYSSNTFKKIFLNHGFFDIVANFAAHKHVRSEKDIFSIEALLYNNLLDAHDFLELLSLTPPKHFFCVSTDKAANPVNIMGASKKLMEEMIFAYHDVYKVTTARFANVAFSNGSLMDGFLKRIQKGQPISCPKDVTRFFVSEHEAGEICLMSSVIGNSNEIFFPKLLTENDLINFSDILMDLLKTMNFRPFVCATEEEARSEVYRIQSGQYPIYLFTTNTSGEKLYEEFYTEFEQYNLDRFASLGVIEKKHQYTRDNIREIMSELRVFLGKKNLEKQHIVDWLKKYLPEFDHIEKGLNLDNKM